MRRRGTAEIANHSGLGRSGVGLMIPNCMDFNFFFAKST